MRYIYVLRTGRDSEGNINRVEVLEDGVQTIESSQLFCVILEINKNIECYTAEMVGGQIIRGARVIVVNEGPRKWLRSVSNGIYSDNLERLPVFP